MTADPNFDRALVGWLDERAVTDVPDGLLARSLAGVNRTRQRPTWLVAERAVRLPGNGRLLAVPTWAILVVIVLACTAVVATGAKLILVAQPVVPLDASPSVLATAPVETPIVKVTDTATPPRPIASSAFASLRELFAATERVAWASTQEAIYRTEDTGHTWRAVQPSGWRAAGATLFLDADTAYFSAGGQPASIAATHDGGSSWATSVVDASAKVGAPVFSFRTPAHGFATFVDPALEAAPAGTGLLVFETTDGGQTWDGPRPGVQPHMRASTNKLPVAKGGFLVQSAVGDLSLNDFPGSASGLSGYAFENWFFVSNDGGVTWAKLDFPADLPKGGVKAVDEMLGEEEGRLLLSVTSQAAEGLPRPQAIYEGGLGASAWHLIYEEPRYDFDVQFLSATAWILTSPGTDEIRSTTDAGVTWSIVTATTPPFVHENHDVRRFATPRVGWTSVECMTVIDRDCGSSQYSRVLYATVDGGLTWTEVGK